jgi:hypothetical protein
MKAWDRQKIPKEGTPYGWIQWKGTNVCMDVHCNCGFQGHIDADFAYNVGCPECGTVYMCNGHIELVELTEEEKKEETYIIANE